MKKLRKGRPVIADENRKKAHYSVWLTLEQKKEIDALIKASNLPASQFFLTQILGYPIKRPIKKSIPKNVLVKIVNLEKLSGLLSLCVLKTKDKQMIAGEWAVSAQNVRLIIEILKRWIFHDFELPQLNKSFEELKQSVLKVKELMELNVLIPAQDKKLLLERICQQEDITNKMIHDFQQHYLVNEIWINSPWQTAEIDDIHKEIKTIL